ncbi:MAG: hypothetical protein AAGI51_02650 [Pseudomonadota bacterium]
MTLRRRAAAVCLIAGVWAAPPASAGSPEVVGVSAVRSGDAWRFDVTVAHADEGWEHYADAWEVRLPSGEVLGTRELLHPHVTEQPFTRSLSGIAIPEGVEAVEVFARDSVHGWGEPVTFRLPR